MYNSVKLYFTPHEATEISLSQPAHRFFRPYVSILAAGSHPAVDVAHAPLRSNYLRGASVHDSLTTTTASHNLTIYGNTERETQHNMHHRD